VVWNVGERNILELRVKVVNGVLWERLSREGAKRAALASHDVERFAQRDRSAICARLYFGYGLRLHDWLPPLRLTRDPPSTAQVERDKRSFDGRNGRE